MNKKQDNANGPVNLVDIRGRGRGVLTDRFLNPLLDSKEKVNDVPKGRGILRQLPKNNPAPSNPNSKLNGPSLLKNNKKTITKSNGILTEPGACANDIRKRNLPDRNPNILPAGAAKPTTTPSSRFPPSYAKSGKYKLRGGHSNRGHYRRKATVATPSSATWNDNSNNRDTTTSENNDADLSAYETVSIGNPNTPGHNHTRKVNPKSKSFKNKKKPAAKDAPTSVSSVISGRLKFNDSAALSSALRGFEELQLDEIPENSNNSLLKFYKQRYSGVFNQQLISYIKQNKVMFIMRGLPGSGKSTLANFVISHYPANIVAVCSADNYRYDSAGNYCWRADKVEETHQLCQQEVLRHCKRSTNVIIIDNTNIKLFEFDFYLSLAQRFHYKTILLETNEKNPQVLTRNVHSVPTEKIMKMKSTYEVAIPRYICWSLAVKETGYLKGIIRRYLATLLESQHFMCSMSNNNVRCADDFLRLYDMSSSSTGHSESHVTSAYFERKHLHKERNFLKKKYITDPIGSLQNVVVTGFCITPRSLFARVTLEQQQKKLWTRDDTLTAEKIQYYLEKVFHCPKSTSVPFLREIGMSLEEFFNVSTSNFCSNFPKGYIMPNYGVGSTAHATMGVKSPWKPVESRNDSIRVIIYELSKEALHEECTDEFIVRKYGNSLWCIYFKNPVTLPALFCAFYR